MLCVILGTLPRCLIVWLGDVRREERTVTAYRVGRCGRSTSRKERLVMPTVRPRSGTICVRCHNPWGEHRSTTCPDGEIDGWEPDETSELCSSCGANISDYNERVLTPDVSGCGECLYTCNNCDDYVDRDNARYDAFDEMVCPGCYEDGVVELHDYNYRPSLTFYAGGAVCSSRPDTLPYLGIELEMECRNAEAGRAVVDLSEHRYPGYYFCKSDGSLGTFGVEMVSHPGTLSAHRDEFPWEVLLGQVKAAGARSWSTDTCGIHIHINRHAFQHASHLWRFARLIDGNPVEMGVLAGRTASHWAQFNPRQSHAVIAKKPVPGGCPDRYSAVNLTNEDTVEIRIFRGSVKYERVMTDLELVDALYNYSQGLGYSAVQSGGLAWTAFRDSLTSNTHPHLCRFVERNDQLCA